MMTYKNIISKYKISNDKVSDLIQEYKKIILKNDVKQLALFSAEIYASVAGKESGENVNIIEQELQKLSQSDDIIPVSKIKEAFNSLKHEVDKENGLNSQASLFLQRYNDLMLSYEMKYNTINSI
ncbi:hypothetical protein [Listeria kieliensis]|uniref:Uncharacterized protein n=1 Tax=Listeria kieliensis TaxID=1621700 RepID=A0A3D8TR21_9LIST|nr:hypothetical protein [Listeria kieliensis]RDX01225.1 hypothetical protein UR08_09825 [Listeria kieliensis]